MIKKLIIPDDKQVLEYCKKTGLNKIQSSILINRGIKAEDADMVEANLSNLLSPATMYGATDAAKKIIEHIKNGSKIVNYSDGNDADGAMAAVVFSKMMDKLGSSNHEIYTNNREEGFGMNPNGIDKLFSIWPDTKLIVSSDNGIVAFEAVKRAQELGIEVVITDHHEPSPDGKLPDCICVNPHMEKDTYEFKELCGTAVLWKVLTLAYFLSGIKPDEANEVLDIVATATVADVVPLINENRIIVKEGLKRINNDCRPQRPIIREKIINRNDAIITAKHLGWNVGPSINATSRMTGSIKRSIDLFLTDDLATIEKEVLYLKDCNEIRKGLTEDQFLGSLSLTKQVETDPAIIIAHEEFELGLVGLISGRIKERYYKPSICFGVDDEGNLRGSGRSIPGIHMKEILDQVQEKTGILLAYGGHELACGLSLKKEDLDVFTNVFNEICDTYPKETYVKTINVDAILKHDEITSKILDDISYLEPYGASFDAPIILVKDIDIKDVEFHSADGLNRHISVICDNFKITSWNASKYFDLNELKKYSKVTAFGSLSTFNGTISLTIDPEDIKFK